MVPSKTSNRRSVTPMGLHGGICLPTRMSTQPSHTEDQVVQRQVLLIVPFCSIEAVVQVVASTTIGLPSDPIGHT